VHVRKGSASAKLWLTPQVRVARSDGFDAKTLRELVDVIEERRELIERTWNELDEDMSVAGLLAGHADQTHPTSEAA